MAARHGLQTNQEGPRPPQAAGQKSNIQHPHTINTSNNGLIAVENEEATEHEICTVPLSRAERHRVTKTNGSPHLEDLIAPRIVEALGGPRLGDVATSPPPPPPPTHPPPPHTPIRAPDLATLLNVPAVATQKVRGRRKASHC